MKIFPLLLPLSLILFSYMINASFLHKIRTILMGGKSGKTKVWEFISEYELQYPGNNLKKIIKIQEAWNAYYNCLTTLYSDLGPHKTIKPEILMIFEGTSVQLKCKTCVPPSDITRTDDVLWNYRTIPPTGTSLVELGEHKLISPHDKTLHMYGLTIQDTGQYFCQRGDTVTSAYFLEVVDNSEPTKQVKPLTSEKGPYPEPPNIVNRENIQIITVWSKWSKCSTCGIVGKRVRYGICTVQQLTKNISHDHSLPHNTSNALPTKPSTQNTNQSRIKKNLQQVTKSIQSISKTLEMSVYAELKDKKDPHEYSRLKDPQEMLNIFASGIPCRSRMLPPIIKNISFVRERRSEILVGFCKEACPEPIIFKVIDEKGNELETANNSAGIYSTLQGIPQEKPTVQRETIYEDTLSKQIILRCPGNLNSDVPIVWQIGSFNIDSTTVYIMSHGRIYLNVLDQIVIKEPQVIDSNIYSCWQNGELAGTIRLTINKRIELSFNHEINMIIMILVLGTFAIVFFRAFRARNRPEAA